MFFPVAAVFFAILACLSNVQAAPSLVSRATKSGYATTYSPSVGLGACGHQNSDSNLVVAVGKSTFDSYPGAGANPNTNPICGKHIEVTNPKNSKSVKVKVVDSCPGCGAKDLDLSPAAFAKIFNGATTGHFAIKWDYE